MSKKKQDRSKKYIYYKPNQNFIYLSDRIF